MDGKTEDREVKHLATQCVTGSYISGPVSRFLHQFSLYGISLPLSGLSSGLLVQVLAEV